MTLRTDNLIAMMAAVLGRSTIHSREGVLEHLIAIYRDPVRTLESFTSEEREVYTATMHRLIQLDQLELEL